MTKNQDANMCCNCLLALMAFAFPVAFAVFGGIALFEETNSDFRGACKETTIWPALLVQAALSASEAISMLRSKSKKSETQACEGFLIIGVASWGMHEATTQCIIDHFWHSKVQLLVLIWSSVVLGVIGLIFAVCLLLGVCMYVLPDKKTERLWDKLNGKPNRVAKINSQIADAEQDLENPLTNYTRQPVHV